METQNKKYSCILIEYTDLLYSADSSLFVCVCFVHQWFYFLRFIHCYSGHIWNSPESLWIHNETRRRGSISPRKHIHQPRLTVVTHGNATLTDILHTWLSVIKVTQYIFIYIYWASLEHSQTPGERGGFTQNRCVDSSAMPPNNNLVHRGAGGSCHPLPHQWGAGLVAAGGGATASAGICKERL